MSAWRWLDLAIGALAPPACWACRGPLPAPLAPLCAGCRRALPWLEGRRCERCALPVPCGRRCPAAASAVQRSWAPLAYAGSARSIVHACKLRGALQLTDLMAAQIVAGAPLGWLAPPAVIVPVPTHPLRTRRRGYDHALQLARAVGSRAGPPVVRCLTRAGAPTRQLGASRRLRRAPGRIEVVAVAAAPTMAVLVDDVQTTGATLDACAQALRAAGARAVSAVTYARTLR